MKVEQTLKQTQEWNCDDKVYNHKLSIWIQGHGSFDSHQQKELLRLTLIKTTDLFVSTEFVVLENLGGFVMNIHVKHGCGSGMYDLKHTVFFYFAIHTECSL